MLLAISLFTPPFTTRGWSDALSCDAADSNQRNARAPHKHQGHLQDDCKLVLQPFCVAVLEPLRAVSALQDEPLARLHLHKLLPKRIDLVLRMKNVAI